MKYFQALMFKFNFGHRKAHEPMELYQEKWKLKKTNKQTENLINTSIYTHHTFLWEMSEAYTGTYSIKHCIFEKNKVPVHCIVASSKVLNTLHIILAGY